MQSNTANADSHSESILSSTLSFPSWFYMTNCSGIIGPQVREWVAPKAVSPFLGLSIKVVGLSAVSGGIVW